MKSSDVEVPLVESYCPSCDKSFPPEATSCPEDGVKLLRISSDPMLGREIDGRFHITGRLGSGGMGVVYRATQTSIGRDVAIKVIHARYTQGANIAKRFLREAKLCSSLTQPNTVTVLDFGQSEDGLLFLVMELLEGRTLNEVLAEDGPFTVGRMVRIGIQLCEALEAAHGASIVHRDLKPSNILVLDEPKGRDYLKVLDFGLAKSISDESHTVLTQSDAILGTPAYISPEAATGEPMDERSDLYAVGVMLYEVLTGVLPFAADTATAMLSKHAFEKPTPLPSSIDSRVGEVIGRLLAKNPSDRFGSAGELRAALEQLKGIESTALPRSAESSALGNQSTVASDKGSGEKVAPVAIGDKAKVALFGKVKFGSDPLTPSDVELAMTDPASTPVLEPPAESEPEEPEKSKTNIAIWIGTAVVALAACLFLIMRFAGDAEPSPPPKPATEQKPVENPITKSVIKPAPKMVTTADAGVSAPAPVTVDAAPVKIKKTPPQKPDPEPDKKPPPVFLEEAP